MIVVTGANGQLGRGVIEGLLSRMPGDRIVASVRDPSKAADLAVRGVHVRAGDFGEPGGLPAAFAGAGQVLVVSVDKVGEPARLMHRTAIEAARAAGARRVLYTSHMGTHAHSPLNDHAATEAFLDGSGMNFTSLRHGFYAESAFYLVGDGFETGEIRAPEDGPISWTSRADLAEADAALLAEEGRLEGITPPLTAPEAVTMADLAASASELLGREIRRVTLSDDAWRGEQLAKGVPPPLADMLLGAYRAARRGDFAAVDPLLGTLLGRRPKTMRDVLAGVLKPS